MLRSLVIIAEIVLLVTALRSPFAEFMFKDIQATVADWMVQISQIPEQRALKDLRQTNAANFSHLRPFQNEYLDSVLTSRVSVNRFYRLYCDKGDKNPNIYGSTLHQFCVSITQTSLLDSQ